AGAGRVSGVAGRTAERAGGGQAGVRRAGRRVRAVAAGAGGGERAIVVTGGAGDAGAQESAEPGDVALRAGARRIPPARHRKTAMATWRRRSPRVTAAAKMW